MALDTTGDALALTSSIQTFTSPGTGFIRTLEVILDAGFQKATPSKTNIDITVAAGSLSIPFTGTGDLAKIIGIACATYWSSAIGKGSPTQLATVSSVTNDAAKIALPIENNLKALATGVYRYPSYYDFVNAIHKEVITIKWDVTEVIPATSILVTVT